MLKTLSHPGTEVRKFIWLFLLVSFPVFAQTLTIHAVYSVLKDGFHLGTVTDDFTISNGHYRINSVTQADGLVALLMPKPITATSEGTISKTGLRPLRFDQWRGGSPDKDIHTLFNWTDHKLAMAFNGQNIIKPLPKDAQDRLSLMYNYSVTALPVGQFTIPMTTGKKIEAYTLRNKGIETIQTPAGTWKTEHIKRVTQPGDKGFDLWLAPSENYLPVRMIISDSDGGGAFEQTLIQLKVNN